ncbi:MAG: phage tail sheath family protein [Catenulispora sp.]|nr:phage tail sheath family protein [Catenulispora sp.]
MAALAPGVYIQSVASGMRVVSAAGTSVAAFLGTADLDSQPVDTPIQVTNWQDFLTKFVAPVTAPSTPPPPSGSSSGSTGSSSGSGSASGSASAPAATTASPPPSTAPPLLADAVYGWFANGGGPCYIVRIAPAETSLDAALTALEAKTDVTIVAAPGLPDITGIAATNWATEQQKLAAHCRTMGNRVALLDLPAGTPAKGDVAANVLGAGEVADSIAMATDLAEFAVVYYPWVTARSVYTSLPAARAIPPSGHVAGAWARTDAERGVHKAPANVALQGIQGLQVEVTDALQAPLNDRGVNCLRTFPGQGSLVWGARTLAARDKNELDFKYVNVRRFINFLSDSIKQSTRWAVFEPNNSLLQSKVAGSVASFLTDQWRLGALVGATAAQSFYVICDERNNTSVTMAQGDLVCDIGVAPSRPAEFVHFRITQTYS